MGYEREIDVALAAAVNAGKAALAHQAKGFKTETKPDLSPVTVADRESETLIAAALLEAFPHDGMLGEEGAHRESASGRRWIIDPIDGTHDFVRGLPTWAVLIALEDGGSVVTGVCHFPALDLTYSAVRWGGAFRNGAQIRASKNGDPATSMLCINDLSQMTRHPLGPRLLEWVGRFSVVRCFGGCVDAMVVAGGQAEVWLEPHAKAWDLAPLKIIAEEAGARFFNFDGRKSIYGGNCAICTPPFEVELRRFVLGATPKDCADAPPPMTPEIDPA